MMARAPSNDDDDLRSLLTQEELDGLNEEEGSTDATPADEAALRDEPEDEGGDDPQPEAAPAPVADKPAPKPAPAGDTAPPADEPPGRDDGAPPGPQQVPLLQADEDLTGKRGRLEEIVAAEDALAEQLEDGEITAKAYRESARKLATERENINWAINRAQLAEEMSAAQRQQAWTAEANAFLARHPFVNANPTRLASFDGVLKTFSASDAAKGLTDRDRLEAAYAQWQTDLGIQEPQRQAAPAAAAKPGRTALPARAPLPPTLSNVPAADPEAVENGEFAEMERLASSDPLRYQALLAKMPDDKRDAYLRGG